MPETKDAKCEPVPKKKAPEGYDPRITTSERPYFTGTQAEVVFLTGIARRLADMPEDQLGQETQRYEQLLAKK